jgi:polyribonucleotide nucleotidyltransferase
MSDKEYSLELGSQNITFRVGGPASQANASVFAQMGDTVSFAAITMGSKPTKLDYMPLQVVYEEKYYAGGKIAGSRFRKREGRPADNFILLGRAIDRGLRPMFPQHLRHDIQIICSVLSYDFENEHDVLSANAANLATAISNCPADGPLGSIRVGMIGGELVLNPSREARMKSDLDLFLTASPERVVMIEAGANELIEADFLKAVKFGKKWAQKIATFFADLQKRIGLPKILIDPPYEREDVLREVTAFALPVVSKAIKDNLGKKERRRIFDDVMGKVEESVREQIENGKLKVENDEEERLLLYMREAVDKVIKEEVRRLLLEEGIRMSGRKAEEIRTLKASIDPLPRRVHGSGLFQRGDTVALTTVTLGAPGDRLIVEGMEGEQKHQYFHHYNFPPYSVGEIGRRMGPGNREIGHGNLAQRSIEPVLPPAEEFPYTIRAVTEILSSSGSTSMAATCGSTLALMAAGVPIRTPVSGIALGLISDEEKGKYIVLSDLQDEEDFGGDMDFKIAGTTKGITAVQVDIKIKGLPDSVIEEAIARARTGRLEVLEVMLAAIAEPRKELSPYAPRIETVRIDPADIRLVIGKGGETIQKITEETGVEIDIEDSGLIFITSADGAAMQRAKEWIMRLTEKPEVGKVYTGKVTRIIPDVGAIVEFLPGKDGMVHISELQWQRTERVEDVVKTGDEVQVKLVEADPAGDRNRLSIRQLTEPPPGMEVRPQRRGSPSGRRGGPRHGGGKPLDRRGGKWNFFEDRPR